MLKTTKQSEIKRDWHLFDAKDMVLGRLSSFVAKKALEGEEIKIINVEQAVFTGDPRVMAKKWKNRDDRGEPFHGPFMKKTPIGLVRRVLRGMLPPNQARGREALKRIKCFIGNKENKKGIELKKMHIENAKTLKYMTVQELCKAIKK